ncbi:hypothetical protein, partial [Gluconacetobacter entanii]|uniref:hypothetical protein n=1 Tax=Gluconacetobacter entanii TaxID=108528 RepID=UPI002235BC6F
GGRSRHEVLQKTLLDADRQPAATTYFHTTYQASVGLPMPAPNNKSFWVPPFFKKAASSEAF